MTKEKQFFWFWGPALLYGAVIFAFSSYPLPFLPGFEIRYTDRFLHAVEYGILGYLLARAFLGASRPFFQKSFQAWAVAVAVCYGFTDELHQLFVPMRQMNSWDLVFDGVGAFAAQFFFTGKKSG
ncbi:MAG: VanZ family protein [Candidatus Omnitrophota bacterium]